MVGRSALSALPGLAVFLRVMPRTPGSCVRVHVRGAVRPADLWIMRLKNGLLAPRESRSSIADPKPPKIWGTAPF